MKKDKLKSTVIKFAIAFFIVLALLTYFSKTINNMLLPKVKVTYVEAGTLDGTGSNDLKTHYLLPISSVEAAGDTGIVYIVNDNDIGSVTVDEVSVNICDSDELYCEVTSDSLFGDSRVVYKTTKSIKNGLGVYIEEETV